MSEETTNVAAAAETTELSYGEFINNLKARFNSFVLDAELGETNKSAALRARKLSMKLRTELQDFRRVSTANDKVNTKHRVKSDVPPVEDVAAPSAGTEAAI